MKYEVNYYLRERALSEKEGVLGIQGDELVCTSYLGEWANEWAKEKYECCTALAAQLKVIGHKEVMSPKWQCRRTQPPYPHKDQQLDSYSQTKPALGEFQSPLRNFSITREQKN